MNRWTHWILEQIKLFWQAKTYRAAASHRTPESGLPAKEVNFVLSGDGAVFKLLTQGWERKGTDMRFEETPIKGAWTIDLEPHQDERGFFADLFCQKELMDHGLCAQFVQAKNSLSKEKGTLRGLHYQLPPKAQDKLVRCIRGRIWDVLLDLRPHSSSFGQWFGTELSAENRRMLYVPKGFAHAFLTLESDCELLYFVTDTYAPELERGIRWNDPCHDIAWPLPPQVLSHRDESHPDWNPAHHLGLQHTVLTGAS